MSDGNRDELLIRWAGIVDDGRFAKGQQWRVLYYSLFLFSAAIVILLRLQGDAKDIIQTEPVPFILKIFIGVIAGIAVFYLWDTNDRLKLYRAQNKAIIELLRTKCDSEINKDIEETSKKKSPCAQRQNFVSTVFYTSFFSLFILAGATAVILIIKHVQYANSVLLKEVAMGPMGGFGGFGGFSIFGVAGLVLGIIALVRAINLKKEFEILKDTIKELKEK